MDLLLYILQNYDACLIRTDGRSLTMTHYNMMHWTAYRLFEFIAHLYPHDPDQLEYNSFNCSSCSQPNLLADIYINSIIISATCDINRVNNVMVFIR